MAIFFGDRRRAHLDRPDRRRLPDRVDLAIDLLDQRPGRDHRPLPHLESEAGRKTGITPRSTTRAPCSSAAGWGCWCSGCSSRRSGAGATSRPGPRSSIGLAILAWFVFDQLNAPEPAAAAADLRESRLRGRLRRPLLPDDRLRPALLLRQRVRADLTRRIGLGNRALPADLLRRVRDRDPVGRQNARPDRGAAAGGHRVRGRRRRLLPLGQVDDPPLGLRTVVLHRARRGRGRAGPLPRQHRRAQPGRPRSATARRPGSRRRCGTSAPASGWRSSARC